MSDWAGIALALRRPEEDRLRSRVPTYIHPLAGRALAWHGLRALAEIDPPPAQLLLVSAAPLDPSVVRDLPADIIQADADSWWAAVDGHLDAGIDRVLLIEAAAPTLQASAAGLVRGDTGKAVVGSHRAPMAAWLDRDALGSRVAPSPDLAGLVRDLRACPPEDATEDCVVRDRAALVRAGEVLRDRLVAGLMEAGVSFLLPATVLVDVDVHIGPDSVIYPGVVLEGQTTIGAETVIGPGCRIIDSWVGSGVELKGWNHITGANIRNRAVLEPYVRRGFD